MIFGVRVCSVGGDDVAYPSERAARPYPEARCNYQPKYSGKYAAVVELAHTRNDETQESCCKWITHFFTSTEESTSGYAVLFIQNPIPPIKGSAGSNVATTLSVRRCKNSFFCAQIARGRFRLMRVRHAINLQPVVLRTVQVLMGH